MNSIQKLAELFAQFPGIGPRQSKRFVYFLLTRSNAFRKDLARLITELEESVAICDSCCRFFTQPAHAASGSWCPVCGNANRNRESIMVVEKDVDVDVIEKSGAYHGVYFVLGGHVPILEKKPEERIRSKKLLTIIESRAQNEGLKEVILALSLTGEGENTMEYLIKILEPLAKKHGLKISVLGRGLSTGTELEYSDSDTIKNALVGRR